MARTDHDTRGSLHRRPQSIARVRAKNQHSSCSRRGSEQPIPRMKAIRYGDFPGTSGAPGSGRSNAHDDSDRQPLGEAPHRPRSPPRRRGRGVGEASHAACRTEAVARRRDPVQLERDGRTALQPWGSGRRHALSEPPGNDGHPGSSANVTVVTLGSGTPRRTGRGHLTSYGDGRLCAMRDCATKLSRYNSTQLCSVHERAGLRATSTQRVVRSSRTRPAEQAE